MRKSNQIWIVSILILLISVDWALSNSIITSSYGVDISFPIHHLHVLPNTPSQSETNNDNVIPSSDKYDDSAVPALGNRQAEYDNFIKGCADYFGPDGYRCMETEYHRIELNLRQPQSMLNYTKVGFKKIRAPPALYHILKTFWNANKEKAVSEPWGPGNTFVNNWISNSSIVSIYDSNLRGGGSELKRAIHDAAGGVISEWTGQELVPCSLYGIRIYRTGAILSPHVDRLPLVSSAIINVDQDLDEPWPLEVYSHDGVAYNVTMEPGDMVLYESHSVIHGRPFPLKGRYMANIFIHFEPTGNPAKNTQKLTKLDLDQDINMDYRESLGIGQIERNDERNGLPPYIRPGSIEARYWYAEHEEAINKQQNKPFSDRSKRAHHLARTGDILGLNEEIRNHQESIIHDKDDNGWTILHESIYGGHFDIVRLLVDKYGANFNAKTYGNGGSALWWSIRQHGVHNPITKFLESLGAINIGPEL